MYDKVYCKYISQKLITSFMQQKALIRILTPYLMVGFFILTTAPKSNSQEIIPYSPPTPNGFIGFGMGVNDYGLGLGAEISLNNNLWVYGMGGYSTWGYRLTGGLTYYPGRNGYSSSFSLGYSYASGEKDFVTELDVENTYSYYSEPEEQEVTLDLNPINTINLIYSYNVRVGRNSKFVFSTGYAISLTDNIYKNKTKYFWGKDLTDGSKDFIKFMAPGGIIIGIKYMIGGFK